MTTRQYPLYTIGYSCFDIHSFPEVLKKHDIGAVVDIRSAPYSKQFPAYNRESLNERLRETGFDYVYMGNELGARPKDPGLYTAGVADFAKMAASGDFQRGLERIRDGLNRMSICLMCAEKDPVTCHRTILVARSFRLRYPEIPISHIRHTGRLEKHKDAELRLMALHDLDQASLLIGFQDRLTKAFQLQEKAIAWKKP